MTEHERLIAAAKSLSESFNALSDAFIKFSMAYASVSMTVRELEEKNPSLFDHLKDD